MRILGIESSCDDTGMALVEDGRLVASAMSTQAEVHALFGGVVPEIASREHYRLLGRLWRALLDKTGGDPRLDAIAVARGPGLLGSLLVGVGFAKGLALGLGARLVGVNHLHAHLLACGLVEDIPFPALGLLVSGGHTQIYHMRSALEFELLGRTLDDAAGEAFDKVAKMCNLPYPGGRCIDALGQGVEPDADLFPRPYIRNSNLDFSFSGLKTSVAVFLEQHPDLVSPVRVDTADILEREAEGGVAGEAAARLRLMCASFNHSVADTLRVKVARALKGLPGIRSLVVAGGVAANSRVRSSMASLAAKKGLPLLLPPLELCTDNAAMIAYAGYCLAGAGRFHGLDLDAVPRGRPVPADFLPPAGKEAVDVS